MISYDMIKAAMVITLTSVNLPAYECLHESDVKEILEAALDVADNKEEQCLELLQKFLDYSEADYVPNSLFDRARYLVNGKG